MLKIDVQCSIKFDTVYGARGTHKFMYQVCLNMVAHTRLQLSMVCPISVPTLTLTAQSIFLKGIDRQTQMQWKAFTTMLW